LRLRFRDLKLNVKTSAVKNDLDDLYAALARRNITFKPHAWLSTEWFSPDGIPGIAIPFYAAHPRLTRLERHLKGEAEGGNRLWRRRILRHEAGHALDTAFALRRRADWRQVFGRASKPYPRHYSVRPASRRYVQHLGHWYAQSHPVEDFAETFAVWLQPRARWRRDYSDWPALKKLEYVDRLMAEISRLRPCNVARTVVGGLRENSRTLREHYRRSSSADDASDRRYDAWLRRTFRARTAGGNAQSASRFLRDMSSSLRRTLIRTTDADPYLVDHVVHTVYRRCRELDLVLPASRMAKRSVVRLHERVVADMLRRNREVYVL
jgi:hypothetical protein